MSQNSNKVLGWILALFTAILVIFIAALFGSKSGEIAQSLGNVIGAAVGSAGAFAVAYWTMDQNRKQENEVRSDLTNLLNHDVTSVIVDFILVCSIINIYNYPDGRIGSELANTIRFRGFKRFTNNRNQYQYLGTEVCILFERLSDAMEVLESRLLDFQRNPTVDKQVPFIMQLDQVRLLAADASIKLNNSIPNVFAMQAASIGIFEYFPFPPNKFTGKQAQLGAMLNSIATEHHMQSEPS